MQNKLQELTDKLYREGLSKGREEGERLLEEARAQAEETLASAREEAASIIAAAEKQADDLRSKVQSDLRMAAAQCLQATRRDIENVVVAKLEAGKVSEALAGTAFIKEIIRAVAERFDAQESSDLALVLPDKLRSELEPWVAAELAPVLKGKVAASFSKNVGEGFTIGPAGGAWFVSFTEETFNALIAEYLRPVTRKLLFGE